MQSKTWEREKVRYRSDEKFKNELQAALKSALGEGNEQDIAFSMLARIEDNETPTRSILEKLEWYATHFSVNEAQVVSEV